MSGTSQKTDLSNLFACCSPGVRATHRGNLRPALSGAGVLRSVVFRFPRLAAGICFCCLLFAFGECVYAGCR